MFFSLKFQQSNKTIFYCASLSVCYTTQNKKFFVYICGLNCLKMNKDLLKEQIVIDEGLKLRPYKDTENIWTVACGRNLEGKGLSKDELFFLGIRAKTKEEVISYLLENPLTKDDCFYLLDNDIDDVLKDLRKNLSWFDLAPEVVQRVLANMCFNLGINRLLQFKKTLSYLKAGKYAEASIEMLNSKWRNDVGDRAIRLSNLLKAQANA